MSSTTPYNVHIFMFFNIILSFLIFVVREIKKEKTKKKKGFVARWTLSQLFTKWKFDINEIFPKIKIC